jgi:hypothetical protein
MQPEVDSPVVKLTVRRVHALGKMYDLHLDYSPVLHFQSHSPVDRYSLIKKNSGRGISRTIGTPFPTRAPANPCSSRRMGGAGHVTRMEEKCLHSSGSKAWKEENTRKT